MMIVQGEMAWASVAGTELATFSPKEKRGVLVAYLLDADAFVYPLSTTMPRAEKDRIPGPSGHSERTWVIVDRGLYRVPLASLQATGIRVDSHHRLKARIQRDLERREERHQTQGKNQLSQHPFQQLAGLKKPVPLPAQRKAQPPAPKSDRDLFEQYMKGAVDDDVKRRGNEGRGRG